MSFERRSTGHPLRAAPAFWFGLGISLAVATAPLRDAAANDYASAPLERGATLSLWASQPYAPGRYALALGLQARSFAVGGTTDTQSPEREGSASNFELLGTIGVWRSVDVSAVVGLDRMQLPAAEGSADAERSSALGDVRLIPRLRLLDDVGGDGIGAAFVLPVWRPGGDSAYHDHGFRIEPRLVSSLSKGAVTITVNAAYQAHAAAPDLGVSTRNFITGGVGTEIRIVDAWAALGEVLGRWSPHDRSLTDANGFSSEARIGARYASSGWAAQFGGGRGLLGVTQEPDWRLLATLSFSPVGEEPAAAAVLPEAIPAPPRDDGYINSDSDWRPPDDPAPAVAEQAGDGDQLTDGAPVAAPSDDSSVSVSAPRSDVDVAAPAPGLDAREAALPSIAEVIHFASNQMRLDANQRAQMRIVAAQMKAAPPHAHFIVEGHSDSAGPKGFNWSLSRMRATTVRYHLIQLGIPWRRVSIRAQGASRPASDTGGSGQPQNRRVEFRVATGPVEP